MVDSKENYKFGLGAKGLNKKNCESPNFEDVDDWSFNILFLRVSAKLCCLVVPKWKPVWRESHVCSEYNNILFKGYKQEAGTLITSRWMYLLPHCWWKSRSLSTRDFLNPVTGMTSLVFLPTILPLNQTFS